MTFERIEFRKRASFPEPGTEDFRKGMQTSLEAYGAALDYVIEAMKHIRESFREMIREQIGMEQYEEYLKDNRAAEKAKEMRPDAAERNEISEQEQETQEEDRKQREEKALQERPEKPNDHQGNQMEQDQAFGQHVMSRTETGSEGERDAETPYDTRQSDTAAKLYDTHKSGAATEHDAGQQLQEKRRGR